jgi:hypothetical protein
MRKLILGMLLFSALFYSCSKDQKVVRELDGKWMISSRTYNGVEAPSSEINGIIYDFEACKVKDGDCNGSITAPDSTKGTITYDFKYNISDKGTKFTIKVSLLGVFSESLETDIVEHSKSKFVYKFNETSQNASGASITTTTVETLTKI